MKTTLVAATRFEIAPAIAFLENQSMQFSDQWEVLITGIGSLIASHAITSHILRSKPSLMIQAGIAGSFSETYKPGSLVLVEEERLGDLGVEEKGEFQDLFDMQFLEADQLPFSSGALRNGGIGRWSHLNLPLVKALTVNEISSNPGRIAQLRNKYFCEIETMEGAAFHYACLTEQIPFLQLRSVSNVVGERDKNKWQLRHSIKALNATLLHLINNHTL